MITATARSSDIALVIRPAMARPFPPVLARMPAHSTQSNDAEDNAWDRGDTAQTKGSKAAKAQ